MVPVADGADGQVVTSRDVVKGLVVAGTAGDAVDGRVDEAQIVLCVLVGQRHQPRPLRRGGAGAGRRRDLAAFTEDDREAAGRAGVTGHVRHVPHPGHPGDAILVGGPGYRWLKPPADAPGVTEKLPAAPFQVVSLV